MTTIVKLFEGTSLSTSTGKLWAFAFTPETNQSITKFIMEYNSAGDNTKQFGVGLYDDKPGAPNNLLASGFANVTAAGWLEITLGSPYTVTGGVTYWLACQNQSSSNQFKFRSGGGAACKEKDRAWDGTFPNPYGSCINSTNGINEGYVWEPTGWSAGSKVLGVANASLGKINGISIASISKVDGV